MSYRIKKSLSTFFYSIQSIFYLLNQLLLILKFKSFGLKLKSSASYTTFCKNIMFTLLLFTVSTFQNSGIKHVEASGNT